MSLCITQRFDADFIGSCLCTRMSYILLLRGITFSISSSSAAVKMRRIQIIIVALSCASALEVLYISHHLWPFKVKFFQIKTLPWAITQQFR
jgi:hypothetical protein